MDKKTTVGIKLDKDVHSLLMMVDVAYYNNLSETIAELVHSFAREEASDQTLFHASAAILQRFQSEKRD